MKSMLKTTLSVIALAATAGFASAHNYKEQLNDLNSSWECQDHYDRGDAIAGNIDKFEFCVWYLNNDKQGFFRDLNWYDITDSGDVIAIDARNFTSERKATEAIKVELYKLVEAKAKNAALATENGIIAATLEASEDLVAELQADKQELIESLTTAGEDLEEQVQLLLNADAAIDELEAQIRTLSSDNATANAKLMAIQTAITTALDNSKDRISTNKTWYHAQQGHKILTAIENNDGSIKIQYRPNNSYGYDTYEVTNPDNFDPNYELYFEHGLKTDISFTKQDPQTLGAETPIAEAGNNGYNDSTASVTTFHVDVNDKVYDLAIFDNNYGVLRMDQEVLLADFVEQIANDIAEKSFDSGYLSGYADGYDDGYSDGYQDGYAVGFKDGVNSVTPE